MPIGGWLGALCQEMGRDGRGSFGRFGLSRTSTQGSNAGSVRSTGVCLGGYRDGTCVHVCVVFVCVCAGVGVMGGEFG